MTTGDERVSVVLRTVSEHLGWALSAVEAIVLGEDDGDPRGFAAAASERIRVARDVIEAAGP